jgi:hypothetical protein
MFVLSTLGQYITSVVAGIRRRSCSQHISNRYTRFREGKWCALEWASQHKFQRSFIIQIIVLGSLLQVIAYAIQSSAPPFPVFVLAYFINGVGGVFQACHLAWSTRVFN